MLFVPAGHVCDEDKFQYEPECYYEQHKAKDLIMVPQYLTDVLAAHVLSPTVHDYHNVHIPEKYYGKACKGYTGTWADINIVNSKCLVKTMLSLKSVFCLDNGTQVSRREM